MTYNQVISVDAKDATEAAAAARAIQIIVNSIKDKKHLIALGTIVEKKPGLIEKGIPYLKML